MDKKNLAFGRMNYILLAIGMAVVIIGFILMSGAGSTEETFNPDIFSARRIKVAPLVCVIGFVTMIVAVMYKKKEAEETDLMKGDAEPTEVKDVKETKKIEGGKKK